MESLNLESLTINLLQSKVQEELLDRLDELRSLGFRRRISPPRLVLCGDQNSGKSTVFEAITGVALPVNDGICTRFATEVIFRKSAHCSAHVRIRPGPTASPDHRRKLGAFSRPHNWLQDIARLFSEARLIMGLVQDGTYSQDALQLEVSGPTLPDLTVVDLPGLLELPGPNQTHDDVLAVQRLTEYYMNNPRNIILAVVSGEYLLSEQTVLHTIAPCASRTLGIMTKPDLIEPGSVEEDSFCARLKNQDPPVKLGWHLLRNLDTSEKKITGLTRDDLESMFISTMAPWKDLSSTVVGIDALRNRLRKIIHGQIELQLTTLASDIQKDLETTKTLLERLGPSRATGVERRLFLMRIGERFTSLTKAATMGEYQDPFFTETGNQRQSRPVRRLRSVIRSWAETFATDMEGRGHSYTISEASQNGELPQSPREHLSPEDPRPVFRSDYIRGLADLLKQHKGRELPGMGHAQVVGELFVRYSLKWTSIAKAHVFEAWKMVKQFLDDIVHYIAGSDVGGALLAEILNHDMEEKLQRLYQKVEELVLPYKRALPSTLNRQLTSRIKRLQRRSTEVQEEDDEQSELRLCSEILDCMQSYYSVALGVFVDNVANLAVENCLINGLEDLISPSRIAQMSDEEIDRLTADSEDIEASRTQLSRRIKVLEMAAAACAKCELNALHSAAQNYTTPLSEKRTTQHSSVALTVNSETSSSSPPISPATPDTDYSSAPTMSHLPARGPKIPKQNILRAFPLPTRVPSGGSPLPQPPRGSASTEPYQSPTSPTTTLNASLPPPPKVPSRSQSLASSSSGQSATTTKSSKSTKRTKTTVWDDRPTPWQAMSLGMFRPV